LSSFNEKIVNIESALKVNDFERLSTLIHQLSGSSGSYGFNEIHTHSSDIEKLLLLPAPDVIDLDTKIQKLIAIMRRTSISVPV